MSDSETRADKEVTTPPPLPDDGDIAFQRPLAEPDALTPVSHPIEAADPRWSRPATPRQFSPSPPPAPEPGPPPRGWEWSRTSSPRYQPPPGSLLWPAPAEAPSPASAIISEAIYARPKTTLGRIGLDVFAVIMALLGGLIGLLGAFFQELQSGAAILAIILAAPVIEEVLKPSGIYLLLLKWPQALRGRFHTALLCAISGAVFGVIESLIYVEVYFPEGSDSFVLFRFTVTPIMHALASFIVGAGITRGLLDWANGRGSLPRTSRNCFLAGIGIHAVYNTTAVLLGVFGILDFGD